jgi:D-amino-acid dehydrogenase
MGVQVGKKVLVIGAGIVGCSAALWLQRDAHDVTVVDRHGPGEGASKGNASVIATESCVPVATPGILWDVPKYLSDPLGPLVIRWSYLPKLAPWLWRFVGASSEAKVEAISIALRSLLAEALAAHKALASAAGCRDIIQETGWLGIYETDEKFRSAQWDLELQRRRGIKMEVLKAEEIRQFEPSLQPIYRHAVYYPEVAYALDNYRLVRTLAEDITRKGGHVVADDIVDFEVGADGPKAAIGRNGRYEFDAVVIAAGAWSRVLSAKLGETVPLETERGYHVTLPHATKRPRMPLYSGDHSFAVTPLDIGLRFAGTVELGGLDLPPNPARNEVLMKHGRRMFGALDERDRSDWMGFRPSMPDSKPVIDRGRRFNNAFFAFGHGHIGLTLGPITGKLVADLVSGRKPGIDLKPFAVDRF